MPLVSVVLPVRDGGPLLAEAVASILGQSHRELELIVVDDHSRDGAVEGLGRDDARLRIIPSAGQGVSAAFNTGFRAARASFIARMDADDVALPERLERQLGLLEAQPEVAIAGARVEMFSDDGIAGGNRHYERWLNSVRSPEDIRRELFVESPIPNPTALFRREALERLGGYGDPRWPEDYDLFLRADALGLAMAKPEEVLLRWRDHGARLTRTDSRYAREEFQRAKAHFLVHGRGLRENILIWGAGPGGRLMHDLLVGEGAEIAGFVDVHPRRIGGRKRDLPVWPVERAANWTRGPILVAVGARGARERIRAFMRGQERVEGRDYLFVA